MKDRVFHPVVAVIAWAGAMLLLSLAPPAQGRQFGDLADAKAKRVTWKATLSPSDPFADANQPNPPTGKPLEVRRGETVLLTIQGTPEPGWHTFSTFKLAPSQSDAQLSKLTITSKEFVPVGPVQESEPRLVDIETGGKEYEFDGPFTWTQKILVRPTAPGGKTITLSVLLDYQVCSATCIKEKQELKEQVMVSDAPPAPLTPELEAALRQTEAGPVGTSPGPAGSAAPSAPSPGDFDWRQLTVVDRTGAVGVTGKDGGLTGLLVTAILGGLISLATPCVFPMIPITVSIFLKQEEAGRGMALARALVYCLTLVVVLTIGGVALGSVLQQISQHWGTNMLLTSVFVFFGLSLLGMYDITLPSWLSDRTAAGESRGGLLGIVFMALTFSIISFACVGPIYGGFTALSASSSSAVEGWVQRILAPLAFSAAFASPFFVLALFPRLLKSMPRSGSWMNTVKVTMGFLELAAAFKFVRAAELNLRARSDYFTFDLVMGIYVALGVACGLYLLNLYRLPHDHEVPESIGVPRLMFGLMFLSLSLYFLPGVFKDDRGRSQKPRGVIYEWVSAFLLPDDPSDWSADLATALARAERENKPLFIDFTGLG
jgi:thiol:disulfide interchange protein DsbD